MEEVTKKKVMFAVGIGLLVGLAIVFFRSGISSQFFQGNIGAPPTLEFPGFEPTGRGLGAVTLTHLRPIWNPGLNSI